MEKNIKFLAMAAMIFKVLAWISTVFFIIVALIVLFGGGGVDTPRLASIIFLLGGGLYFLILLSISEALRLMISIHEKVEDISLVLKGKS